MTWGGLEPSKHTRVRFEDGADLLLDHQAGLGRLVARGALEAMHVADGSPRLSSHYVAMMFDVCTGRRPFSRDVDRTLHELLLSCDPSRA